MAVKINAGDVKRSDIYSVDPYKVVVKEELRGRKIPPTAEAIMLLAVSMLARTQIQPVSCRRLDDKRLLLTAGFTRCAAARIIREGFDFQGEHHHDPDFMLKVVLAECNDEEALKRNIVENCHRNETSPIDDAHNQNKLRERYGMSDADITRLYEYGNPNKVGQLKKLLSLSDEEQTLVHNGDLSVSAALKLLPLDADKRAEVVANATKDTGKVDGSSITAQVRDHHLNDDNSDTSDDGMDDVFGTQASDDTDTEPAKKITRSMREVKNYLNERAEDEEMEVYHDVLNALLGFIAGTKTERQMDNAFKRLPIKQTRKAA